MKLIEECIQSGHFELSSGLHSNTYVQCATLIQNPYKLRQALQELAFKVRLEVDVVVGPAYGGIVIAHVMADILGARSLFTERVNGEMVLRRGQELDPSERVLVIDDVVTTGKSFKEVEKVVTNIVGYACLVNRSNNNQIYSLAELDIPTYEPSSCPLCRDNITIYKPGSRLTSEYK